MATITCVGVQEHGADMQKTKTKKTTKPAHSQEGSISRRDDTHFFVHPVVTRVSWNHFCRRCNNFARRQTFVTGQYTLSDS